MKLIDEHISFDRRVNTVFLMRLEAIIYPCANQNDLYDWIYKILKFRDDLFWRTKTGKRHRNIL